MPPDHIPGKPVTDGEWQVKTTMEIHYISESLQDLKRDFKELGDIVKEQVQHTEKISQLNEDMKEHENSNEVIRKELSSYKREFNKLSGRFSVITTIFGLIMSGIVGYFFWGAKNHRTSRVSQPAPIVKKVITKGHK